MASNDIQVCDICNLQHVTSEAIEWCPECEEHLCEKCKTHHALSKSTRKHETMTIENIMKLPEFVRETKINCVDHDERFVYFCNKHFVPCCIKCLNASHKECRNLSSVEKVIRDVKSSSSFSDLQNTVSDIITNIDNIMKDRKDNLHSLIDDKEQFLKDVQATRDTYNKLLDKLEADITSDMEQSICEKQTDIEKVLEDLGNRRQLVADIQENIDKIKKHASDFQSFVAMQELIKVAHEEENKVEQLFEGEALKWSRISMKPTLNAESLSFGSVDTTLNNPNVSLQVRKIQEAQLFETAAVNKSVEDILLTEKAHASISTNSIMDCCISPDGNLILTDRDKNRCIVLDNDGKLVKNFNLPFSPIGITFVEESKVAVTTVDQRSVTIIDWGTCRIVKAIPIQNVGGSILFRNETFVVQDIGRSYKIHDVNTGKEYSQINVPSSNSLLNCFTCIREKFYHVNSPSGKTYCRDFNGTLIWEFQHKKLLAPYGITSNNSDILFVTGFKSRNIFAISTDGTSFREIIGPMDKLASVISIDYNAIQKQLLICTQKGNVFLYDCI